MKVEHYDQHCNAMDIIAVVTEKLHTIAEGLSFVGQDKIAIQLYEIVDRLNEAKRMDTQAISHMLHDSVVGPMEAFNDNIRAMIKEGGKS